MTVTVNDRRIQYTATAGQTIFPYDFKIDANTEITVEQVVYLTGAINTLTLTTEYTVSGVGDAGGGNITLVTGAAVNDTITIIGNTPLSRTTDFNQAGDFLVSDLNNQLDKLTNILQENNTTINRAVKLKDSDTTSSLEIPTATNRASKFLAFDASGNAIASAGTAGVVVSSFMETVLDDTTAAAARTTLDTEQKANSLTAITTLQDADQFIVADNSDSDNSKKITKANLQLAIAPDATTTTQGISYLGKLPSFNYSSSTAISVTSGAFTFSDGSGQAYNSYSGTKTTDAWTAGTGNGGLDTGSIANNTWYYVYSIYNPTIQATDYLISASPTSPTLPSGYTKYTRLKGFFKTNSSGLIIPFNLKNGTWINKTTVAAEQVIIDAASQVGSTGTLAGVFPAIANTVNAVIGLQTSSPGYSSFTVWGNLQATPSTGNPVTNGLFASSIGTNNGFGTTGTALIYNDNGILSYRNWDSAGGVTKIKMAIMAISDNSNL